MTGHGEGSRRRTRRRAASEKRPAEQPLGAEDLQALKEVGYSKVGEDQWLPPDGGPPICEGLALAMLWQREYPWREEPPCPCGGRGWCVWPVPSQSALEALEQAQESFVHKPLKVQPMVKLTLPKLRKSLEHTQGQGREDQIPAVLYEPDDSADPLVILKASDLARLLDAVRRGDWSAHDRER